MNARIDFYLKHPIDSLPIQEREGIGHVLGLLEILETHLTIFRNAVELLEYAKSRRSEVQAQMNRAEGATMRERHEVAMKAHGQSQKYLHWQFIAARDAAMTVYHFGIILHAIRSQLGRYPTLLAAVNTKKIKEAYTRFLHAFPRAELIRHCIAHTADTQADAQEIVNNRVGGMFASCCMRSDDVLWMTFKARSASTPEVLTIAISSATTDRLRKIVEITESAFR